MNFSSSNKKRIYELEAYILFSTEFDYYIEFLQDLSNLFSYNGITISCIIDNKIHFLDTSLIESSVQTLNSIKSCCSIGSFSDANTLIRKLRDDLLLYIFILDTIKNRKTFNEDDLSNLDLKNGDFDAEKYTSTFLNLRFNDVLTENEQAVNAWFNNAVNDLNRKIKMKLSFENYMIHIQKNPSISEILVNYNLQGYWEKLRNKLNDYVHNNGNEFTRQNNVSANDKFIETHLKNINFRISYISSFFLVLLIMIDSKLIAATDLIDHLDSNAEPPKESQYFVATFVKDFLDLKVSKLHPELKQYLKDNNDYRMRI